MGYGRTTPVLPFFMERYGMKYIQQYRKYHLMDVPKAINLPSDVKLKQSSAIQPVHLMM